MHLFCSEHVHVLMHNYNITRGCYVHVFLYFFAPCLCELLCSQLRLSPQYIVFGISGPYPAIKAIVSSVSNPLATKQLNTYCWGNLAFMIDKSQEMASIHNQHGDCKHLQVQIVGWILNSRMLNTNTNCLHYSSYSHCTKFLSI